MSATYVISGIAVAMLITFASRVIPFPLQAKLANSVFLRQFSRWMPLGAMVILFVYACQTIPFTGGYQRWLPYLVALVGTIIMHSWRRNVLLSIVVGTGMCVALSIALAP